MRSSVSSLLALSAAALVVGGCGESTTHSAADVQRAFAAEQLQLSGASIDARLHGSYPAGTASYRIGHALATLASRQAERWSFTGRHDLVVVVLRDPYEARAAVRAVPRHEYADFGLALVRKENVLVACEPSDRDVVRRALDRL